MIESILLLAVMLQALVLLMFFIHIKDLEQSFRNLRERLSDLDTKANQTRFELRGLGRELGYRWKKIQEEGWEKDGTD